MSAARGHCQTSFYQQEWPYDQLWWWISVYSCVLLHSIVVDLICFNEQRHGWTLPKLFRWIPLLFARCSLNFRKLNLLFWQSKIPSAISQLCEQHQQVRASLPRPLSECWHLINIKVIDQISVCVRVPKQAEANVEASRQNCWALFWNFLALSEFNLWCPQMQLIERCPHSCVQTWLSVTVDTLHTASLSICQDLNNWTRIFGSFACDYSARWPVPLGTDPMTFVSVLLIIRTKLN